MYKRQAQIEAVVPLPGTEISARLGEEAPPERKEFVAAHRLARLLALPVHGKDEMQVGMRELGDLHAVGAASAGVPVAAVGAVEVLHIGHSQRKRAGTGRAREELGMAHASPVDALREPRPERLLSYDVGKPHLSTLISWFYVWRASVARSARRRRPQAPRSRAPARGFGSCSAAR